jgi:hypothetical protein
MSRWQQCNILQLGANARRVWQFDARKKDLALAREQAVTGSQPVPSALVGKSWSQYWQPKLNLAWLPADRVFLRVEQLPVADLAETRTMVEFQLEKISPLPVGQIVWSVAVLPKAATPRFENAAPAADAAADNTQTVVITIVARSVVEEFLGQLEGAGFFADRIETSLVDQLAEHTEDGAWIFLPENGGKNALVAWRQDGTLKNLGLLQLPASCTETAQLRDQLEQLAWAGQLEGWLTSAPRWNLVAPAAHSAEWQAAFATALNASPKLVAPAASALLAAATARRAALAPDVGLLPAEFAARYAKQFTDRLWLRGLVTVGGIYLTIVVMYFAALAVLQFKTGKVEAQVAELGSSYTNTMQLKARYQILRDRQELKFAALDCWKATAENLPQGAQLGSLDFSSGRQLRINGTAGSDQATAIIDFNTAMRRVEAGGQPLFRKVESPSLTAAGTTLSWGFSCELNKSEELQ